MITLHGAVDRSASPYLANVLDDLIDGQGSLAVILDLRDVGRVDCSGVEAVAFAYRVIARHGGELALVGAVPAVREVLVASGLTGLVVDPEELSDRAPIQQLDSSVPGPAPVSLQPLGATTTAKNRAPPTIRL